MSLPIRHTSSADRDIVSILDYIAIENLLVAMEIGEAIQRTAATLIEHPYIGERFLDRRLPELRRVLVTGYATYSIYYQVLPDEIVICRVLHNSRDLGSVIATPP